MINKIIFDLETSGLNPYHDDIIEVAMKNINNKTSYHSLVKPKSDECISEKITQITGITNKLLKDKGKNWLDVYKDINNFLLSNLNSNYISLISHNGESFDFIFLRNIFEELKKLGIKTIPIHKIIFIDTLLLSKRLLPRRNSYKQSSLCCIYNINIDNSHRAMNDVESLEKLYIQLTNLLNKSYDKRKCFFENPQMVQDYIKIKYIL
tara:strand:+ start:61 stop:684 length:624 start_codon:yes stop_codon:yes gene_type:complete